MGKDREPIEKGRFRNFQYHYRQLVMLNLMAQEEARRSGQPLPAWKSLNEEGDSTPNKVIQRSGSSSRSTSKTNMPEPTIFFDGIPILTFWSQNQTTGQLSGMVWKKSELQDGAMICTSPVPLGVQSGMVVTTSSGSLYRLQ
jgi:hypothetical protein